MRTVEKKDEDYQRAVRIIEIGERNIVLRDEEIAKLKSNIGNHLAGLAGKTKEIARLKAELKERTADCARWMDKAHEAKEAIRVIGGQEGFREHEALNRVREWSVEDMNEIVSEYFGDDEGFKVIGRAIKDRLTEIVGAVKESLTTEEE